MAKSSAGAIRAGAAYVELLLKNKLGGGLQKAAAQLKAFGAAVTAMGKSMALAGVGILAPLGLAAKVFADMGSDLLDMSQRTGASVETLSALGYAAEQSGASLEEVGKAIGKMNVNLAAGGEEMDKILRELGTSLQELSGLDTDARFLKIAEGIAAIEDPAKRAAAAMKMWGKGGIALLPMLAAGAEGLGDLMAEAHKLGIVMSGEDAAAAESFGDAMSRAWTTIKMVVFQIGSVVAPVFQMLADFLTESAASLRIFLKENSILIQMVTLAGAALVALGGAGMVLGGILSGLGVITGILAGAFSILTAIIGAILSPAGLVIVAVAGIGYALAELVSDGQGAIAWLRESFGGLLATVSETWKGIGNAIAAGDLGLAIEIALAGLKIVWVDTINWLLGKWDFFLGYWHAIADTLIPIWVGIVEGITSLWAGAVDFLAAAWRGFAAIFSPVANTISEIWTWLVGSLTIDWANFGDNFMRGWDLVVKSVSAWWDGLVSNFSRGIVRLANFFEWLWKKATGQADESWAAMRERAEREVRAIDQLQAEATANREAHFQGREQARQDAARERALDELGRHYAREQEQWAREARAARAQGELDRLTAQADWQQWLAEFTGELAEWMRPGRAGGIGGAVDKGGVSTAGTFSGLGLGGLGVGRVQERIAAATEGTERNTERLLEQELAFE